MPIQIDHFETSVDIAPPQATPPRRTESQPTQAPAMGVPEPLRDAILDVVAEAFESFSRMRGH